MLSYLGRDAIFRFYFILFYSVLIPKIMLPLTNILSCHRLLAYSNCSSCLSVKLMLVVTSIVC